MTGDSTHLSDDEIDDVADDAMDAAARRRAESHLAACDRCRSSLDATRALVAWSRREAAAERAPAALWSLVAASTIHLAAVRRRTIASMRGMLIAGALALVAATAVITWKVARWTAPSSRVATPAQRAGPEMPVMPDLPDVPDAGDVTGPGHAGHPPSPPRAPTAPRPR